LERMSCLPGPGELTRQDPKTRRQWPSRADKGGFKEPKRLAADMRRPPGADHRNPNPGRLGKDVLRASIMIPARRTYLQKTQWFALSQFQEAPLHPSR